MKVFLDTNVIIDFYDRRKEYFLPASIIMDIAFRKRIQLLVSTVSFVNAFYLLRKSYRKEELYRAMGSLARLCNITPVNEQMVKACLEERANDFEDAIQCQSAQAMNADVIVTRNKKDFLQFGVKVQTPTEFLNAFFDEQD